MRSKQDELAFLPAALEIVETPPSPIGRAIAFTIIAVFSVAVAWACIGTVDIVAVASGKIIPSGRTKTVQPFETGVVHVRGLATQGHVDGRHHAARYCMTADLMRARSPASMPTMSSGWWRGPGPGAVPTRALGRRPFGWVECRDAHIGARHRRAGGHSIRPGSNHPEPSRNIRGRRPPRRRRRRRLNG